MLNRNSRVYIFLVSMFGVLFIAYSLINVDITKLVNIVLFGALAALAESSPIYISKQVTLSVAFAVDLMAVLLLGPYSGALVAVLGYVLKLDKTDHNKITHIFNRPFYKSLFNISQIALSTGAGGIAYVLLGGIPGKQIVYIYIVPAFIGALIYYMLNSLMISYLVTLLSNKPFLYVWRKDFKWTQIDMLFLIFLGIIMASAFMQYGYISFALFFVPLFMIRYTFKLYMDSKQSYYETINVLIKALEAKDKYTAGHSKSVEKITSLLCRELGFSEYLTERVQIAALLHDVGKIGIPESILNKPGKLTSEEFEVIKYHSEYGYEILKDVSGLKDISLWIKHHHERFDGTGYPDGKKGHEIPLESQILSIADVFDALVSNRPYRKAFTREEAYDIILNSNGTQFSPEIIEVFKKAYEKHKEDFTHDF
ncbi:HD-GYP domain-containing protein [Caldanaerobius polysaccharolyticus]|uniref:HD-GYP domain-containing protein n=1 Tax=Caldanaerobius polysaccharolyticus TaxID=44256 RepID=UPI00047BE5DB|nr:HD-GYP domain-containing protein [Caldanaerobius polysaccharolyticus]